MRACLCALFFLSLPAHLNAQVFLDSHGEKQQPFQSTARARVFLFVRTDCPLTDRYAPELQRLAAEFAVRSVDFWLIYPDKIEQPAAIVRQIAEYGLPGTALLDPQQRLVQRASATVSPQAAVFDNAGRLTYSGRIDDRVQDFGKTRPFALTHDLEDAITATLDNRPVTHPRTRAVGCYLADVR
jgi:thiol-disulfide isomerase/thioredoxin